MQTTELVAVQSFAIRKSSYFFVTDLDQSPIHGSHPYRALGIFANRIDIIAI